jgi:hypothetical protein
MPVPTDTFRNIRTLNIVFAASAFVLFGTVGWLVFADYSREWRTHQREVRVWNTAMTTDAAEHALTAEQEGELRKLEDRILQLESELPADEIRRLQGELSTAQEEKNKITLPTAAIKGEIGPKVQELERARLTYGSDSPEAGRLKSELAEIQERYDEKATKIVVLDQQVLNLSKQLEEQQKKLTETNKQIASITRTRDGLRDKLSELNPPGLAKYSERVRNAPLLDWFNPSEKVQQVVAPDIRIDLNYLAVETIDRCNTCHVNIDSPAFEENNLLLFVERQVATYEGQEIDSIFHPVVMRAFWENAARQVAGEGGIRAAQEVALEAIKGLRMKAGLPVDEMKVQQLSNEMDRIALHETGQGGVPRGEWYRPLRHYVLDVKEMVRDKLGEDEFKKMRGLYRQALIEEFNGYRAKAGLARLSANPVLLAHPRLDLYADAESKHPMKTVGCTSCHEGSGHETDFTHAAHTPEELWVDTETGAAVPERLLVQEGEQASKGSGHASAEARLSNADVNLADPENAGPYAPHRKPEAESVMYTNPDEPGKPREAVQQAAFWERQYDWHEVHYMDWEKPMHEMRFVESSCNKCHTEIFDLKYDAPRLFEGRLLFSQMGCVNCHAIDGLKDDLDIKKVGPSLVHLREKLSPSMAASWVWSPKGFRPTTKMPHYFMLENNSSPVDVLRTRTEVAAMS